MTMIDTIETLIVNQKSYNVKLLEMKIYERLKLDKAYTYQRKDYLLLYNAILVYHGIMSKCDRTNYVLFNSNDNNKLWSELEEKQRPGLKEKDIMASYE